MAHCDTASGASSAWSPKGSSFSNVRSRLSRSNSRESNKGWASEGRESDGTTAKFKGHVASPPFKSPILTGYAAFGAVLSFSLCILFLNFTPMPDGPEMAEGRRTTNFNFIQKIYIGVIFCTSMQFFSCLLAVLVYEDRERRCMGSVGAYITTICCLSYLTLLLDLSPTIWLANGRMVRPLTCVCWLHTTPAMISLYGEVANLRRWQVTSLAIADILMLATAFVASLSIVPSLDVALNTLSCAAYIYCEAILWQGYFRQTVVATGVGFPMRKSILFRCTATITWSLFPIIAFLAAMGWVSNEVEIALTAVADVAAKVTFTSLLLYGNFETNDSAWKELVMSTRLFRDQLVWKELMAVLDIRGSILANVSHELRTPLNAITGLTDNLIEYFNKLDPDFLLKMLQNVSLSGHQLQARVQELLDVQSITARSLHLQMKLVDMSNIINGIVELTRPVVARTNILVSAEVPDDLPIIEGDPKRVHQIIYILVLNAIKFTKHGGITITAQRAHSSKDKAETPEDAVEVRVSDTGEGINAEKLELIFAPFTDPG